MGPLLPATCCARGLTHTAGPDKTGHKTQMYKKGHSSLLFNLISSLPFLENIFIYLYLERGAWREKEREGNIDVREMFLGIKPATFHCFHFVGQHPAN